VDRIDRLIGDQEGDAALGGGQWLAIGDEWTLTQTLAIAQSLSSSG